MSTVRVNTVRDYFAGQALTGCLHSYRALTISEDTAVDLANVSYLLADAMMEARKEHADEN